jgi:mono/diheme cytochrome c family protein
MKSSPLWLMSLAALVLTGCPVYGDGPYHGDDDDNCGGVGGSAGSGQAGKGGWGGWGGSGGYAGTGGYGGGPVDPGAVEPETVAAVASLFRQSCADCHGKGNAFGNLPDIFDVDELKRRGLITPSAEKSQLFQLVESGQEPPPDAFNPRTGQPNQPAAPDKVEALRRWINGGAPSLRSNRSLISLDDYTRLLRRDQSSLSRADQATLAYIDLHSVYNNPNVSNAELAAYANATLKLLNGLDPISTRVQRDGSGTAVVVDDNQVPIAVRVVFPRYNLNRTDIERIVASTNRQDLSNPFECDVPAIPVGDFLQIASADDFFNPIKEQFESTYSNVVLRRLFQENGIIDPNDNETLVFNPMAKVDFIAGGFTNISNFTLADLLEARGASLTDVDLLFNEGADSERFSRACLLNSSVSAANRCLDRFSLDQPQGGSAWVTWDALSIGSPNDQQDFFRAFFNGPANPPQAPIVRTENAFVADGGEVIFQLPNLMQGYAVYNGNLNLVTNPPTFAVLNPIDSERGNFISVRACSGCHQDFTVPFSDAAYKVALDDISGSPTPDAGFLIKAVQPQEAWDFQVADDSDRYLEELRQVYVARSESGNLPDGIYNLSSQYLLDLSLEDIVAELGLLNIEALKDTVANIPDLTANLSSAFGGGMSRQDYTINYQALVDQVASDNSDFLRGCVSRDVSDPGDFGDAPVAP